MRDPSLCNEGSASPLPQGSSFCCMSSSGGLAVHLCRSLVHSTMQGILVEVPLLLTSHCESLAFGLARPDLTHGTGKPTLYLDFRSLPSSSSPFGVTGVSNELADLPRCGSRAHSREGTVLLDKDVNKWLFSGRLETAGPVALFLLHSRLAWSASTPLQTTL